MGKRPVETPLIMTRLRSCESVEVSALFGPESLHREGWEWVPSLQCALASMSELFGAGGCGFFDSTPFPLYYAARLSGA